jgi:hypothetical protein
MLRSYHERTQHLFHHLQPIVTGKEKRHLFEDQLENPRVNRFWDRMSRVSDRDHTTQDSEGIGTMNNT